MEILKFVFLILIFLTSAYIGISFAKRFYIREKELINMRRALQIFEEKIKFTYETVPDVFYDISKVINNEIGKIFGNASTYMKEMTSSEAWEKACDEANTDLTKEDLITIKGMAKMLGKCDLDGQVSEIKLMEKFIDTKIEDAKMERNKNEKMYKTLGLTFGAGIIVVLI